MIVSKPTKQDRELLRSEYRKVWGDDTKMVDFCTKKVSAFMTIGDCIVTIDKPSIQTRFCFGYGVQGAYDYDEAQTTCSKMSQSERYFIDYNLHDCLAGQLINRMDEAVWVDYWLVGPRYNTSCNLYSVCSKDRNERCIYEDKGWHRLTEEELAEYKEMLQGELEKFRKRLSTYLKRYGLSKCRYWTYWTDE